MLVSELIASLESMAETIGDIPIALSILDHTKIEDHTTLSVCHHKDEDKILIQNF